MELHGATEDDKEVDADSRSEDDGPPTSQPTKDENA